MSRHAQALQSTLFAAMATDAELAALTGTDAVTDHPPAFAGHPAILIGAIESQPIRSFSETAEEHRVGIEIVSAGRGHRAVEAIAARMVTLLDGAALALDGATLVDLAWLESRVSRQADAHRASLSFRAVTE